MGIPVLEDTKSDSTLESHVNEYETPYASSHLFSLVPAIGAKIARGEVPRVVADAIVWQWEQWQRLAAMSSGGQRWVAMAAMRNKGSNEQRWAATGSDGQQWAYAHAFGCVCGAVHLGCRTRLCTTSVEEERERGCSAVLKVGVA